MNSRRIVMYFMGTAAVAAESQCQQDLSHVVVCVWLSQKRSVVVASEGARKDVDFGDLKLKAKEML